MASSDQNIADTVEPEDSELTELVAYLDGELEPAAEDLLERRLVQEAGLRRRAEMLDRTWQLLNALEEVSASGEFSQKTIASLSTTSAHSGQHEKETAVSGFAFWRPLVRQMALAYVAALLVTASGILAGNWYSARQRDPGQVEMLQNLELLESYFSYRTLPDVQFLRDIQLIPESRPEGESPTDSANVEVW